MLNKRITKTVFNEIGDLDISLCKGIKIQAFDNLEIDSKQRDLYEILVMKKQNNEMFGIKILKNHKKIIIKKTRDCILFSKKEGIGKRFMLKDSNF